MTMFIIFIFFLSLTRLHTNTLAESAKKRDRPDQTVYCIYMRDDVYAVIISNIHIT